MKQDGFICFEEIFHGVTLNQAYHNESCVLAIILVRIYDRCSNIPDCGNFHEKNCKTVLICSSYASNATCILLLQLSCKGATTSGDPAVGMGIIRVCRFLVLKLRYSVITEPQQRCFYLKLRNRLHLTNLLLLIKGVGSWQRVKWF